MATTKQEIGEWFDRGIDQGATHMLVICDTYDWEDYPKYVFHGENVREVHDANHGPNMQKVLEVYALHLDKNEQLAERRAFHLDEPPDAPDYIPKPSVADREYED